MKLLKNPLVLALASAFLASTAAANTFYVSPDGNNDNDGSSGAPFKTVDYAVSQAYAGDEGPKGGHTIYLKEGHYGTVNLVDYNFSSYVTIQPVPHAEATLDYLYTEGSSYLAFSGLTVMPTAGSSVSNCNIWQGAAVVCFRDSATYDSANIKFENGVIKSFDTSLLSATSDHDASLINAADPEFWASGASTTYIDVEGNVIETTIRPRIGVHVKADNTSISGNLIANVSGGVNVGEVHYLEIDDNQIINNSGNGVYMYRSNYIDIDGNVLKNFYGAKTNYSDSYKSKAIANYSPGTEVTGVRITNNFITPADDAAAGSDNMGMGGAIISYGNAGGILSNWTVSKNVIFNGGWHSITLDNAKTIEITNNLEVDVNTSDIYRSFGVSLGFGEDWGNNDYSEVNQVVTCNVVSGIGGSYVNAKALALDPSFDDHNVLGSADESWATDVNSYWDDECEVELSYRLIDKAM
ncbi:MAG: right-handed parallel beta-helix repeat-containing protein [Oceanobacter sp.]